MYSWCVFLFNIITYLPINIIVICLVICNGECVLTFVGNKEMNEWMNADQRNSLQYEQNVGWWKKVAMNWWPWASWTLRCLIAPRRRAMPPPDGADMIELSIQSQSTRRLQATQTLLLWYRVAHKKWNTHILIIIFLFSSYVHRLESLRPRGHDLMLPACTGYLHKQSFIIRSLFEFF